MMALSFSETFRSFGILSCPKVVDFLCSSQDEEEFASLAVCVGLLPSAPQPSNAVRSASCLDWPVSAFDLVTQWVAELTELTQMHPEQSLVHLSISVRLLQPLYRNEQCPVTQCSTHRAVRISPDRGGAIHKTVSASGESSNLQNLFHAST